MAVGLGMEKDKIEQFYAEFERTVRKHMSAQDLVDHIDYDGEIELTELNDSFFQILDGLGPFGHGNPQPVFRINRLETVKAIPVGEQHTRGILRDRRGDCMDFIAFNRSADSLPRTEWDVIATPQINEYYGERKFQVQLLDLQPSYGT